MTLAARIVEGRLILSAMNDARGDVSVEALVRRVGFDGRTLDEKPLSAKVHSTRAVEVGRLAVPDGRDFFYVIEGRHAGAKAYDPSLRVVVFPDKFKRYDLPDAAVRAEAGAKPGTFTLSADRPAFFVKPEASEFAGAFDDASFALLPGEKRTVTFRSFDERMPGLADVELTHLAATYR